MSDDIFEIDIYNLERELQKQPDLFYEAAKKSADARDILERAKATLDVIKAEVEQRIRANPEAVGLTKVTESAIASAVILDPEYRGAQTVYLDAKHNVDIMWAQVNAYDHRKSALERLVSLHGQNYFATPKLDDAGTAALNEKAENRLKSRARKRRAKDDE